jgi:predicted O-methyltransferase YrrM
MNTLIEQTLNGTGDSDQHILTLFSIAVACKGKTFIELGVRSGTTTIPLLEAATLNSGKLYSVDISPNPFSTPNINNWEFIQSDAIEFLEKWETDNMPTPDFVYIDDWHSYEHVKKELDILDRVVSPSTVILLHDLMYGNTCPFYHTDLTLHTGQWANGGPYRATAELNPQFWEFATLPWNNGLTILRKKYSNKFKQR